jgi:hypothetical protein
MSSLFASAFLSKAFRHCKAQDDDAIQVILACLGLPAMTVTAVAESC